MYTHLYEYTNTARDRARQATKALLASIDMVLKLAAAPRPQTPLGSKKMKISKMLCGEIWCRGCVPAHPNYLGINFEPK